MVDLERVWGNLLDLMMEERGEMPTELFRQLQDGAPTDFRDYLEKAYLDGRISAEEFDLICCRKPQAGNLAEAALIVCEVFRRLGLFAPRAGKDGEA